MAEMRSQLAGDRPGAPGATAQAAQPNVPATTVPTNDEAQMRATAVDAMVKLGIPRRQAQVHVDSVHGEDLEELVNNAFAHRQSLKEGKVVPDMIKRRIGGRPAAPIGRGNVPPPASMPPQGPMPVRGPSSTAFPPSIPAAPIGQGAMPTGSPAEAQIAGARMPDIIARARAGQGAPPLSPAQIAALGMPPGGTQAAPSAEALQQQVAPPGAQAQPPPRRNFYAERIAAAQGQPQQQPTPAAAASPFVQRLRSLYPAAPIAQRAPVARGTIRGAEEQPPPAPIERKGRVGLRVKEMKKPVGEPVEEGEPAEPEKPTQGQSLPWLRSQDEVEKLNRGDKFIWAPNGHIYQKH